MDLSIKFMNISINIDDFKSKSAFGLVSADEKITLQEWINTWLTQYKINDSRPSTLERYHGIYKNYIRNSQIGVMKLKDFRYAFLKA